MQATETVDVEDTGTVPRKAAHRLPEAGCASPGDTPSHMCVGYTQLVGEEAVSSSGTFPIMTNEYDPAWRSLSATPDTRWTPARGPSRTPPPPQPKPAGRSPRREPAPPEGAPQKEQVHGLGRGIPGVPSSEPPSPRGSGNSPRSTAGSQVTSECRRWLKVCRGPSGHIAQHHWLLLDQPSPQGSPVELSLPGGPSAQQPRHPSARALLPHRSGSTCGLPSFCSDWETEAQGHLQRRAGPGHFPRAHACQEREGTEEPRALRGFLPHSRSFTC